ncbi:hypothetical protein DJ018_06430 [Phenylobacterium deserti]|uniref:DUF418 domain-containing protein n=2 Tax=Phenylobacterium deserti TaxID=1914756 RepID=A0A328AX22_9CAUL|nr:hypothetical protein DJ018_06430 [Phenylobacterium deserti]
MVEQFELYWLDAQGGDVLHLVLAVFGGKAFALFALCFGLSFFIIMDRASQRGVDFRRRFVWRLTLLFGLGLLHTAVYRGDVLTVLAPLGLLLIPFDRIRNNAVLIAIAAVCFLQPQLVAMALAGYDKPPAFTNDPSLPILATSRNLLEVARLNLTDGAAVKYLYTLETGRVAQIIGLFLTGLVLGRSGFFADQERFALSRRLGFLAALAVYLVLREERGALLALFTAGQGATYMGFAVDSWINLSLMFAEMLAFLELCVWVPLVTRLLAPVGRMTLSLYVGQSLLFVPVYYGFGLGMYRTLPQIASLGLGVAAFAVQIAIAHLWFRRFHFGPLEWAWRSLTYLSRDVPFLRRPQRAQPAPA